MIYIIFYDDLTPIKVLWHCVSHFKDSFDLSHLRKRKPEFAILPDGPFCDILA